MFNNDDPTAPRMIWPSQLKTILADNTITIEEIAERADISVDLTLTILEGLWEADRMVRKIVPICPVTQERVGEYDDDTIEDPVSCPFCHEPHDLAAISVSIQYTPIPFDEEDVDADLNLDFKVTKAGE